MFGLSVEDYICYLWGFIAGVLSTVVAAAITLSVFQCCLRCKQRKQKYAKLHDKDDVSEVPSQSDLEMSLVNPKPLNLYSTPSMDSETFQELWEGLKTSHEEEVEVNSTHVDLEPLLAFSHIFCMASGTVDDVHKYFFYGREVESDHVFLVEAKLYVVTKVLNLSFRSTTSQANMQRFIELTKAGLKPILDSKSA